MKNKLLARWLHASRLSNFFTHFSGWQEEGYPEDPADLQQEYQDLFMGVHADIYIPLWASTCKYAHGILVSLNTNFFARINSQKTSLSRKIYGMRLDLW